MEQEWLIHGYSPLRHNSFFSWETLIAELKIDTVLTIKMSKHHIEKPTNQKAMLTLVGMLKLIIFNLY